MANEFIIKHGFHSKGNSQVTGSLGITGSVDIEISSGSAFIINESDSPGSFFNRLDFHFDNKNPVLEVAARQAQSTFILSQDSNAIQTSFTNQGLIVYRTGGVNYGVQLGGQFKPNTTNQQDLGNFNRRWKNLYLYASNKISWGTVNNTDLVSLRNFNTTNTLQISGSSDVTLDVKGAVSASKFTANSGSSAALPGYSFHHASGTGLYSQAAGYLQLQVNGGGSPEFELTTGQGLFRVPLSLNNNELINPSRIRGLGSITGSSSGNNLGISASLKIIGPTRITGSLYLGDTAAGSGLFIATHNGYEVKYQGTSETNILSDTAIISQVKNASGHYFGVGGTGNQEFLIGQKASMLSSTNILFDVYDSTFIVGRGTTGTGINQITGSLNISGSSDVILDVKGAVSVQGSGSSIFDIRGSAGQLFDVQDGLDGVLMSVNDISGIPILTVSSSGDVILAAGSNLLGTASVALNVPGATSAFPFTGNALITGELDITGSGNDIFKVRSNSGSLFSVDDGLDGILMSVNDISGLPLFEVSSSGDVRLIEGNISGSAGYTASFGHLIVNGTTISGGGSSIDTGSLGNTVITGSLIASGSIVDFSSASSVLLPDTTIPLINPQVEYLTTTAITSSGTTVPLPGGLTFISSSTFEYLEVFINGLRLRYDIDFAPQSTSTVKYFTTLPIGTEVTYKSLRR